MHAGPRPGIMLHCSKEKSMTDFVSTLTSAPGPFWRGAARASRGPGRDEATASAASLLRLLRRLSARHADKPDIVAVCEKWTQRVATIELGARPNKAA